MLEGLSLDQLKTFIAAAEEGSFSAAARKLNRAQSAVSGWISALESQIGVTLFDRSGRFPTLTPEGLVLLADARDIMAGVATMKARAKLMTSEIEHELSVVIDTFFPTAIVSEVARELGDRFPLTSLRLFVEGLGAAYEPILDGRCCLGLLATLPMQFPTLEGKPLIDIPLVCVASRSHPLAGLASPIAIRDLAKHTQLVLTDRSDLLSGQDFGVHSPSTWRLADLSTKHAFLLNGSGWGNMPLHLVADDLHSGRLMLLKTEDEPRDGRTLSLGVYHAKSSPPGVVGRWFVQRVRELLGPAKGKRRPPA